MRYGKSTIKIISFLTIFITILTYISNISVFATGADGSEVELTSYHLTPLANVVAPGCSSGVLDAIGEYYEEKGLEPGTTFRCSVDESDTDNYYLITAQYIGNAATQSSGVCNAGDVCQATVWTDAEMELYDVDLDIKKGRLMVSGTLQDDRDAWNIIYDRLHGVLVGITGLGALVCLLAFVLQFIKLGASAGNPAERSRIIKGIIWTGIGTAGCGSVTLIFSMAFNFI